MFPLPNGSAFAPRSRQEASLLNHSCIPNCTVHSTPGWIEIVALRPIAAGEELCIAYIATDVPRSSRQR